MTLPISTAAIGSPTTPVSRIFLIAAHGDEPEGSDADQDETEEPNVLRSRRNGQWKVSTDHRGGAARHDRWRGGMLGVDGPVRFQRPAFPQARCGGTVLHLRCWSATARISAGCHSACARSAWPGCWRGESTASSCALRAGRDRPGPVPGRGGRFRHWIKIKNRGTSRLQPRAGSILDGTITSAQRRFSGGALQSPRRQRGPGSARIRSKNAGSLPSSVRFNPRCRIHKTGGLR